MKLIFQDSKHEQAYHRFLHEAGLTQQELEVPSPLLRRQLAFLYLIALFQEDYIYYEGEVFYIEAYDELSLGGPTYLLEEDIGEGDYPHEKILRVAKHILKGEQPCVPVELGMFKTLINQALEIVM